MQKLGLSERSACRTMNLSRFVYHYEAKKKDDQEIAQNLHELADTHPRWGCRKMTYYLLIFVIRKVSSQKNGVMGGDNLVH
jgi:hypothetical protein